MEKITFIYCFKDRDLYRVKLSLDSMAAQTDQTFKVVFVDYGSESVLASQVEALVNTYPFATYHYNDTRAKMWNRSHALNTGVRVATSPYVFTSDIDMIFNSGFVAKLNSIAAEDRAYFFSAIMLPEGALPGNPASEKRYPRATNTALGWGLIPRKALISINGYDEVYCIWGKEDNDIGHRLGLSGIKVNYIPEIWMHHYYHPPVPYQRHVIPDDWFHLLTNYFDAVKSNLIRNSQDEWGKIIPLDSRQTLRALNDIQTTFKVIEGRSRFFRYCIEKDLETAVASGLLSYEFTDRVKDNFNQSRLYKIARSVTRFLSFIKLPFRLMSIYERGFEDVYSARNELMYMLITRSNEISDYAFHISDDTIRVVIQKR